MSNAECRFWSVPFIPIKADRFLARVEEVARLTGASTDEAFRSLMVALTDHELEHLTEELLEQIFGDDNPAREEFKRIAAGAGNHC